MSAAATESLGLVHFDAFRRELAEATRIDEVKQLHDQAVAMQIYLRVQGACQEDQNKVAEMKLRTERRLGEMIKVMDKQNGGDAARARFQHGTELPPPPSLSELRIGKTQSHRWQLEADVPESVFEEHIAKAHASPTLELTSYAMVKLGRDFTRGQPDANAPTLCADGIYTTLVADPPWRYSNVATRAAAEDHYPTLSIAELCALTIGGRPVRECAGTEAHLYLWTTNAFLREAFEVIDAWGFQYKTSLVWVKPQLGIGNYFRSSHEHVLFGVRGALRVKDSNQRSWFEVDRGRHSQKPDYFYDLVEKVSPGPYLELFARTDMFGPRPGWTPWGNQA